MLRKQLHFVLLYINIICVKCLIILYYKKNSHIIFISSKKDDITTIWYQENLKTENVILYLLKGNSLNVTQLMKNLFAVDFLSYKINNKTITDLNYAHASYGPIVDKRAEFIDNMIKINIIKTTTSYNDDFIIFENVMEPNTSIFNDEELEVLKKAKKALKNKTATELTSWSHDFIGWKRTKMGQSIDFKYSEYFELPS